MDSIQNKRNKLSRSYYLVNMHRSLCNGYLSGDSKPSMFEYFSRFIEYQILPHYFGGPPFWRRFLRKFNGRRTLPDFCVIGPIKSGTSDLAINILLHPNIMTPLAKEIYIADPEKWRIFYPTERQKKKYSLSYGSSQSPFLAPFLHWMELTYNLSKIQPNTKIVLTLRDPVKRAYSHWKWEVFVSGRKRANELPFLTSFSAYVDKAIAVFPEYPMYTACGFNVLQTGIYWKAVSYWIECFGRDNVMVLDVADYFSNSNQFLNQIYDFVGLPNFDCPIFSDKINENPVFLPPPDKESIIKLSEFFKPHNEKLWIILDKKFDWI